jgi:hypothetical protein
MRGDQRERFVVGRRSNVRKLLMPEAELLWPIAVAKLADCGAR